MRRVELATDPSERWLPIIATIADHRRTENHRMDEEGFLLGLGLGRCSHLMAILRRDVLLAAGWLTSFLAGDCAANGI
jgi:hypothetical protein